MVVQQYLLMLQFDHHGFGNTFKSFVYINQSAMLKIQLIQNGLIQLDSDGEARQGEGDGRSPNMALRGQISTPGFLHELQEPGVPPHELRLKESAICVLI
ncbi:unnamed protein product [Tuber aestivum]|uniref:Uncharacterized protein n=1 Tax=Tuber aestivum TaxID=59557 RepID=A0A292PJE9_9PEZI|nr:unnamed protein product [Tuber aestivum]